MKQILQSFKTGEMWLAEVSAPQCKGKGAVVAWALSLVAAYVLGRLPVARRVV